MHQTRRHHPLRHQLRVIRGGKASAPVDSGFSNWKDDAFLRAHYLEKRPERNDHDNFTFLSLGNSLQPWDDEDIRA